MDQTNISTVMNRSLFTDDEGQTTDTADSSDQEYRYILRFSYNNLNQSCHMGDTGVYTNRETQLRTKMTRSESG